MPIATKRDLVDLSSENQTEELAKKLSKKIKPGNIVFFHGEIGVGKTTFIKYFINGLQKENKLEQTEITSPTFNLLNEYQINKIIIYHYDLYRLKSIQEIENLELFENSKNSITLVEWPQIIKEKPENLIELFFKYEEDYKKRTVQIKGLDL